MICCTRHSYARVGRLRHQIRAVLYELRRMAEKVEIPGNLQEIVVDLDEKSSSNVPWRLVLH